MTKREAAMRPSEVTTLRGEVEVLDAGWKGASRRHVGTIRCIPLDCWVSFTEATCS